MGGCEVPEDSVLRAQRRPLAMVGAHSAGSPWRSRCPTGHKAKCSHSGQMSHLGEMESQMGALNSRVVVSEDLGPCRICTLRFENKDAEPKGRFLSWGQFHRGSAELCACVDPSPRNSN